MLYPPIQSKSSWNRHPVLEWMPTLFVCLPKRRNDALGQTVQWWAPESGGPITNLPFFHILAFCSSEINMGFAGDVPRAPRHNPPTLFCLPRSRPTKRSERRRRKTRETENIFIFLSSPRVQIVDADPSRIRCKTGAFICKF